MISFKKELKSWVFCREVIFQKITLDSIFIRGNCGSFFLGRRSEEGTYSPLSVSRLLLMPLFSVDFLYSSSCFFFLYYAICGEIFFILTFCCEHRVTYLVWGWLQICALSAHSTSSFSCGVEGLTMENARCSPFEAFMLQTCFIAMFYLVHLQKFNLN